MTVDRATVSEWVINALVDMGVDRARVSDDSMPQDDLGADSLDCLELIMSAEEQFSIEIEDDVLSGVNTVAQACALIEAKCAHG